MEGLRTTGHGKIVFFTVYVSFPFCVAVPSWLEDLSLSSLGTFQQMVQLSGVHWPSEIGVGHYGLVVFANVPILPDLRLRAFAADRSLICARQLSNDLSLQKFKS